MVNKSGATSIENEAHGDATIHEVNERNKAVVDSDCSAGVSSIWNDATTTASTSPTNRSESLMEHNSPTDDVSRPSIDADSASGPSSSSSSLPSVRDVIGNATVEISNLVNDNLIVARYVAILSISSLGIYAFTQTPLFFRYRNVADIPSHYFYRRKTITGRLMIRYHQDESNLSGNVLHRNQSMAQPSKPIIEDTVTCYIRHLSPIESLLSKKWLHRYWNLSYKLSTTSSMIPPADHHNKPEESITELIKVQIAGIQFPKLNNNNNNNNNTNSNVRDNVPRLNHGYSLITDRPWSGTNDPTALSYSGSDWLRKLSQKQCIVRCQFLGRQVPNYDDSNFSKQYLKNKRPIPGMTDTTTSMIDSAIPIEDKLEHQVAIVKLYYHPPYNNENDVKKNDDNTLYEWMKNTFRRRIDLGESMIKNGYAVVSEDGLYTTSTTTRVVDTIAPTTAVTTLNKNTTFSKQVQQDLRYIDQLSHAEYHAAQSYSGVWNNPKYRNERPDIIDEIHFQQHSTIIQKFFRWIRGE